MARRTIKPFTTSRIRRLPSAFPGTKTLLVTRSVYGLPVATAPSVATEGRRPCLQAKQQTISPCRTELLFRREGVKLRFCHTRGAEGPKIAVRTPAEATALAAAYCTCVRNEGRDPDSCVREVTGAQGPLGGLGRRRRRR